MPAPVRFEDHRALSVAGLMGHFSTSNWAGIPAQWMRFVGYGLLPEYAGGARYGLCFQMADGVDYLCGAEITSGAMLPAEFRVVTIPAQRYAVFDHREHVSTLRDTLDAIWRTWAPESSHKIAKPEAGAPDFFERYGERFNPILGTGDIEIWVPIQS